MVRKVRSVFILEEMANNLDLKGVPGVEYSVFDNTISITTEISDSLGDASYYFHLEIFHKEDSLMATIHLENFVSEVGVEDRSLIFSSKDSMADRQEKLIKEAALLELDSTELKNAQAKMETLIEIATRAIANQ